MSSVCLSWVCDGSIEWNLISIRLWHKFNAQEVPDLLFLEGPERAGLSWRAGVRPHHQQVCHPWGWTGWLVSSQTFGSWTEFWSTQKFSIQTKPPWENTWRFFQFLIIMALTKNMIPPNIQKLITNFDNADWWDIP